MTRDQRRFGAPVLWCVLALFAACCMGFYVLRIWSANQPPQFSDLYAPWWGAHKVLVQGRSPYGPEVAHEIQTVIYGAPVPASYPDDPAALTGGFAYPLYAVFLLWPTVRLPFATVQIVFFYGSILMVLGSLVLWLRALDYRPPPLKWLAIILFIFGSFPVLQEIKLQNLSLLGAGLLAATMFCLATERLILAGIFLAVSTFKPQFTILMIPWIALWTASDWRRRQRTAWSFLASMALLLSASEWLVPGWIRSFLTIVRAYKRYTPGQSLLDLWFTPAVGPFFAIGLTAASFGWCWRYRRFPGGSQQFFIATSLMLATTLIVIPTLAPHAQLLLLPGFLCLLGYHLSEKRSGKPSGKANRWTHTAMLTPWVLLAWPWIAAAGLALAAIRFSTGTLLLRWQIPLYTSPLLPLSVFVALICLTGVESNAG